MYCGKCGAQVPDGFEFCMKCGTKIDKQQVLSENEAAVNNVPVVKPESKKNNKKMLIALAAAIIAIIAVVAIVAVVIGNKNSAEKDGYFANIPWGSDKDYVKTTIADKNIGEVLETDDGALMVLINDYDGMKGVSGLPSFNFENGGKLSQVYNILTVSDDSDYTLNDVEKKEVEKYNKLFGEAQKQNASYGSIDYYYYGWYTPNGTIVLTRMLDILSIDMNE